MKGEVQAQDEKEAANLIARKGLLPLHITPLEETRAQRSKKMTLSFRKGLTIFDQIIITRHLGTILTTGTDLLSGLDIIAQDAAKPLVKEIILDIRSRVATGESLYQAISMWKSQFNPVLLNLVRAGEVSGSLAQVLVNYAQELRKDYNFNRKVKGAMIYPLILISALVLMLAIVLWVVIPRLKDLFASTKLEPPFYTKLLFTASDIWVEHYLVIIILAGVAGAGGIIAWRNARFRRPITKLLWRLPYLKNIQQNYSLLRFCKSLATLIRAGIPLENALKITGQAIGAHYEDILKTIAEKNLVRGISLSDSLRQYPKYFPGILISVVATGEKSGQIDATLLHMAEFYEEEVVYALERFLVIIEPLLIMLVGVIIGLMAGSLIAPIYKFIGRF